MLVVTMLVFVGLLLVLVLAHEWGHFLAARRMGCRVEEFAFGFPPRLFAWRRGGVQYSFNLLPIGGYVKIEGEDMNEPQPGQGSFASKTIWQRLIILSAGVIMNVVLAYALLSLQAGVGVPVVATAENMARLKDLKTFIVEVAPGSPAAMSGVAALDRIIAIGHRLAPTAADVQALVAENAGQEITLELERRGSRLTVQLVPRQQPPAGEGALGVALQESGLMVSPWWQAPWRGLTRTGNMFAAIAGQFWVLLTLLVSGQSVSEVVTGPVGIAVFTHEVLNLGFSYVLEFAALISLNLAIINVLPFPALDGGRMLFVAFEGVAGRRLPARFEHYTHLAGFAVLIGLMIFITIRDVARFL
ncbi:MAG: site-2 protease family protein [Candidatus Andersenbacteria bacterium]|nr:site-2 protease family protein [Candidatus Andersenbacteria bacterium]